MLYKFKDKPSIKRELLLFLEQIELYLVLLPKNKNLISNNLISDLLLRASHKHNHINAKLLNQVTNSE
jgi:hypothetical protein